MSKVMVIAEIGVNHNGDRSLAHDLIDAAAAAGADAVKFQLFYPDEMLPESRPMLRKLHFTADTMAQMMSHCGNAGVQFLCTPFSSSAADALVTGLGLRKLKIGSGQVVNERMMEFVGSLQVPVIISNGMTDDIGLENAIKYFDKGVTILSCVSKYPTPDHQIRLTEIKRLEKKFKVPVGYSDHTRSTGWCVAAAYAGAKVIEKHITISREMEGPDHRSSAEPKDFKAMIREIRAI